MRNPRMFANVNARAVGSGIGLAIHAAQSERDSESPEAWCHFCCTAADEAHQAVMDDAPEVTENYKGPAARLVEKMERQHAAMSQKDYEPDPPIYMAGAALEAAARHAAATAFRLCMPKISGRKRTQAYIACTAVAMQRGYLSPNEAKAMLYTAQIALSAHPSRRAQRGRK